MQKIMPCLWFDKNAEEAVRFYTSIFPDSKIKKVNHYGEGAPMPAGTVMTIVFTLDGQDFLALNGGPEFKFSHALSMVVRCKNQEEIDRYWEALSAGGGKKEECGWVMDKYGMSWQIWPAQLEDMITDEDPMRRDRVMSELWKMQKLDSERLKQVYEHQVA